MIYKTSTSQKEEIRFPFKFKGITFRSMNEVLRFRPYRINMPIESHVYIRCGGGYFYEVGAEKDNETVNQGIIKNGDKNPISIEFHHYNNEAIDEPTEKVELIINPVNWKLIVRKLESSIKKADLETIKLLAYMLDISIL